MNRVQEDQPCLHLQEDWTRVSLQALPSGSNPMGCLKCSCPGAHFIHCVVCHLPLLFAGLLSGSVGMGDLCVDPWEQLLMLYPLYLHLWLLPSFTPLH